MSVPIPVGTLPTIAAAKNCNKGLFILCQQQVVYKRHQNFILI